MLGVGTGCPMWSAECAEASPLPETNGCDEIPEAEEAEPLSL